MERREARKARTTERKQARKVKNSTFIQSNERWQEAIASGHVQTWGDW